MMSGIYVLTFWFLVAGFVLVCAGNIMKMLKGDFYNENRVPLRQNILRGGLALMMIATLTIILMYFGILP